MTASQHASTTNIATQSFNEANQLVDGLLRLLRVLGPAHEELSGQAAAAQTVVLDLQRTLSYLHSKAGHAPKPVPWLQQLPQPGVLSHHATPGNTGAVAEILSTPSANPPPSSSRAPPTDIKTPTSAPRPSAPTPSSTRPAGLPSGARSASTSRTRAPGSFATGTNTNTPASVSRTLSGHAIAQPYLASTPGGSANAVRSKSISRTPINTASPPGPPRAPPPPAPPPLPAQSLPSRTPPPSTSSTRHSPASTSTTSTPAHTPQNPLAPLNLPRATSLPLSPITPTPLHPHSPGIDNTPPTHNTPNNPDAPPQLPGSFMRARHEYFTALQQGRDFTTQLHPPHQASATTEPPSHAFAQGGWADGLRIAATDYMVTLDHACNCHQVGISPPSGDAHGSVGCSNSGIGMTSAAAGNASSQAKILQLQHAAQVALAALVAAHTWVAQAAADTASKAGASLPSDVQGMLQQLPVLQAEYDTAVAALEKAQAQDALRLGGGLGQPRDGAGVVSELMDQERLMAAARWRNRFLRAVVTTGVAADGKPAGGLVTGVGHYPSLPAVMSRPLGMWLPDTCWNHATLLQQIPTNIVRAAGTSTMAPHHHHYHTGTQRVSDPPWLYILPESVIEDAAGVLVASQDARALLCNTSAAAMRLPCTSAAHARAHGKGQLQLQQLLFQLWLEGTASLALDVASLPVRVRRVLGEGGGRGPRGAGVGQGEGGARGEDVRRALARFRLMHALLIKNAWNHACSVMRRDRDPEADEHYFTSDRDLDDVRMMTAGLR